MQLSMNIITGINGVFAKKCLQAHAIWHDIVLSVMQNKHGCVCMCAYMCSIAYLYIGDPYIHYSLVSVHSHILTTTMVAVGIHAPTKHYSEELSLWCVYMYTAWCMHLVCSYVAASPLQWAEGREEN